MEKDKVITTLEKFQEHLELIKKLMLTEKNLLISISKLRPQHYVYIGEEFTRKKDYDKLYKLIIENHKKILKLFKN